MCPTPRRISLHTLRGLLADDMDVAERAEDRPLGAESDDCSIADLDLVT